MVAGSPLERSRGRVQGRCAAAAATARSTVCWRSCSASCPPTTHTSRSPTATLSVRTVHQFAALCGGLAGALHVLQRSATATIPLVQLFFHIRGPQV